MSLQTTETYLRNGHAQWYNNTSWCTNYPDESNVSIAYAGESGYAFGTNGRNTVDWGSMPAIGCRTDSLACTRVDLGGDSLVDETDTRFDSTNQWINGQAPDKYDTWGAMAHELGHSLGVDDVYDLRDNIMYWDMNPNDASNEKHGYGDALANNAKY